MNGLGNPLLKEECNDKRERILNRDKIENNKKEGIFLKVCLYYFPTII